MSQEIEWNDFSKQDSNKSKDKIRTLRLTEREDPYVVRLVGKPVKVNKYFVAGRSAICADPETCTVRGKYGIEPSVRYSINIIDRADGLIKLIEVPPTVLKPAAAWGKARKSAQNPNGIDPGGDVGPDFSITVTGQKKNTRYEVVALDPTPLTPQEKEYIKKSAYDLSKLNKPTPDNEIEEKLFGKKEDKKAEAPASPAEKSEADAELPF